MPRQVACMQPLALLAPPQRWCVSGTHNSAPCVVASQQAGIGGFTGQSAARGGRGGGGGGCGFHRCHQGLSVVLSTLWIDHGGHDLHLQPSMHLHAVLIVT